MDYSKFSGSGNWVYLPKMGESGIFHIKKMSFSKSTDERFNFSKSESVTENGKTVTTHEPILSPDTGEPFNLQCELENGKTLSVSSFGAFMQVFKKGDVQDGDKIKVSHPKKGEWLVEKLGKDSKTVANIEDETLPF